MAFDREAAKRAGYTDEEIDAFLQANPQAQKEEVRQPGPVAPDTEPPAPTTVIQEPGAGFASTATTAGLAAAPYALPAAGAAAAAIGGNKLYGAWNASAKAAQDLANAKLASEQGIAQRAAQKMAAQQGMRPMPSGYQMVNYNVPTATGPVAPSPMPTTAPTAPTAPVATAPLAQPVTKAPSLIDKTTAMMRQLAANRVLQGAAQAARVGGIAANAMYSGDLNTGEQAELERRRKMAATISR